MNVKTRVLSCCLLLVSLGLLPAIGQPPPVRIMPLGDSITLGSNTPGGYRLPLYTMLTNAGYNVDYVGTQTGNGATGLPDSNHQGMSGWRIAAAGGNNNGLFEYLRDWLNTIADPDVVLLHIGTNDFGTTNDTVNAINRLDTLVTWVATNRPHANIIMTTLLPRGEPYNTWIDTQFNPFVAGKVAAQQALGRKVFYLDMHAYLTTNDMFDTLHPTAVGYTNMANAWLPAITNIITPYGDSDAPALSRALGITNLSQVAVTFTKPVSAASATTLSNYAIDGGLSVLAASLSADSRTVTLTTSPQTKDTTYTITVNSVVDVTPSPGPLSVATDSTVAFRAVCRGYQANVPESSSYNLLYTLDWPSSAKYGVDPVSYATDNRILLDNGSLDRVAYYVELQCPNTPLTYVWASMSAFTNNLALFGVPVVGLGAVHQKLVSSLNIRCNDGNVVTGDGLSGNIEFWPSNYSAANQIGVPGASASTYDFGDRADPGTYGCMQVHNYVAGQTLFAFNNWGSTGGATLDIGIYNCPNPKGGGVDWTFANNAGMYTIKTLQVLIRRPNDTTPPTIVSAQAGTAGTLVTVVFSEPLAADSVDGSRFSLDNGVSVIGATLQPDLRTVALLTTPQPAGTALTLTVNGVRDSAAGNAVVANTAVAVPALPAEIATNVGSLADGYKLVYTLDIPVRGTFNATADPYRYNQSTMTDNFDRVAYYVELQPASGGVQYLWASVDAFSGDKRRIGVPTGASGAVFQRYVDNLDVKSNVAGVSNGVGMVGGNIEFWPSNYSTNNAAGIANASSFVYDFGDVITAGNHGSMQIHNSTYRQTLFAMNNWGADNNILSLGIGNRPGQANTDWTFADNAASYTRRIMHILVRPTSNLPALPPQVAANVPSSAGYQHAFTIDLPVTGSFNTTNSLANYTLNNYTNGYVSSVFSRVAYYLELQSGANPTQWVWTAMDAFIPDIRKIGIPTNSCFAQQKVTRLDVRSNVDGIVTGSDIDTGNVEFWPSSYNASNALNIPNASASSFDFGDGGASAGGGGYGSMQIHNHGATATQTIFAVNNFNNNATLCVGIGNRPGTNDRDWTFANNAGSYNWRRLYVFVYPGGEGDFTRPTLASALASRTLTQVVVTFSETLADSAATPSFFSLNNGATVTAAQLSASKREILLTTTALSAGTPYTLSVTGVRDRTSNGNLILPGSTIAFTTPQSSLPAVFSNVPEASDYALINQVAIGDTVNWASGCNYSVDQSRFPSTSTFDRVAYCLEVVTNGLYKWVYVSMDAYSADIAKIGVPTADRAALWQQYVSNLNVYASDNVANISVTTGVGIASGNIEFWPSNYGQSNDKNIPGALSTLNGTNVYDFGDGGGPSATTAGHGSMQVHNYLMGHTIFALNSFGSNGRTPAMGIGNNTFYTGGNAIDPDWTFYYNARQYTIKNLYVLAHWGPTPAYLQTAGTPPVLMTQPRDTTAHERSSAYFSVQATGATRYQWRRNGTPLLGETRSFLIIPNAKTSNEAVYDVIVYGSGASYVVSTGAYLDVISLGTTLLLP